MENWFILASQLGGAEVWTLRYSSG